MLLRRDLMGSEEQEQQGRKKIRHHTLNLAECGWRLLRGARMLKTKSVWTEAAKGDGLRILATRFRGRGLPASRYDAWMPALGPSEHLLKAILSGAIDWKTFSKRYREELFMDGPIDERSETIKNHGQKSTLRLLKALSRTQHVTLMCHCDEDTTQCHRFLLAKEIERI
jgi:uncharacterized protein YeaO (DUF488 family)